MTAVGIPQDQICAVLKINLKTLRRHCRQELDCGATEANAMVGQSMFRMATAGPYSVRFQAAKYWLACRAGWRDVERPMSLAALVPVSAMSNEELNAVLRVNGLPAIDDPDPSPLTAPTGTDAIVPFQRRPPRGGR
jgi:5-hydroxyisourate hydrolase-like protein (transthyretin family)